MLSPTSAHGTEVSKEFLQTYCVRCHGAETQEGELALHEISSDFTPPENAKRWLRIAEQLAAGDMPPPDEEKQPSAAQRIAIIEWIEHQILTSGSGEAYQKKLLAPEYGNWVNHQQLFSGDIDTPPYSPARIWRFSPEIFALRGFGKAKSPFTYVTSERGLRDYSAMSHADQSTVQMILIAADSFLAEREKRGEFNSFANDAPTPDEPQLNDVVRREFLRVIGREPENQERSKYLSFLKENIRTGGNLEGLKTTIKAMFLSPEAIYRMEFGLGERDEHGRRHLSPDELAHAIAYALTDHAPDRNRFIREALQREELNSKSDVASLVQRMLDEQLLSGHWDRRDLPRVMRFFDQYFGFHRAGTVFKDNDRRRRENIPQWNTGMMIYDARMLIRHLLKQDQNFISQLLTTNEFFVAHPGDNKYAIEFYQQKVAEIMAPDYVDTQVKQRREQLQRAVADFQTTEKQAEEQLEQFRKSEQRLVDRFASALEKEMHPHPSYPFSRESRGIGDLIYIEPYNLPSSNRVEPQRWDWPIEQPFKMPQEQRAGLLTHPAWLAAHSLNEDNDPIRRGIWVYERLLCGVLGDVPPDVDAAVPTDPHKTLRERMEPLRADRCWKCHRKMNPLGEPFEMFDDWGRYRTHLYFDEENRIYARRDGEFDRKLKSGQLTTRPVDATGAILGTGEKEVDGEVNNAVEMMRRLGYSTRARQSFIRHLFRYLMGRNEMLSDSKTLIDAERAYRDNDGSFKALVVSLLSSDSFIYRR